MEKIKIGLILIFIAILTACSKTEQDPFKEYRGYSSSKIFHNGEQALAEKNYNVAVKNFEALDALYPFGPYAEQGQLDIIYAYYKNGDNAAAMLAADRFIRLYPRSSHVDYAYYMRGIVSYHLGLSWLQKKLKIDPSTRDISNLQQSFTAFSSLTQQFPHSLYAPNALRRMVYIRNLLASREIQVAQFYMQRKAYVVATNRASYVVQHFEGSPFVIKALAIMVKGYRKLGLTSMADSSYQLLQKNFPNSPEARSLFLKIK